LSKTRECARLGAAPQWPSHHQRFSSIVREVVRGRCRREFRGPLARGRSHERLEAACRPGRSSMLSGSYAVVAVAGLPVVGPPRIGEE